MADMILSPLGFVLAFILRYTGIYGILARTARPTSCVGLLWLAGCT